MEQAVKLKKRRQNRGKPLITNLLKISQGEPMFISPTKVSTARVNLKQLEDKKEQAEAQKAKAKVQKQLLKEAKEQQAAAKKLERQEAKLRKVEEREEARLDKAALKQLL